jgi:AcrR family transcriptional regulator
MLRVSCDDMGGAIPLLSGELQPVVGTVPRDELDVRRPRRGRPRSREADQAILSAATDVLVSRGLGGMSIEDVAARAGVAKATIYRRWPNKAALALDAFLAESGEWLKPTDTGTLRGDLELALQGWVRSVTRTRAGSMLAGLLAETRQNPQFASTWQDRVIRPATGHYSLIVGRAVRRGELPADVDLDLVLDLLFGSAGYRLLMGRRPVSDQFIQQVVHVITAGLATPVVRPATPAG